MQNTAAAVLGITAQASGAASKILTQIRQPAHDESADLRYRWERLDYTIRRWWDADLHRATEEEVRADTEKSLLFLPFPYTTAGGSESAFPEIYGWDTQFINLALIAHERLDIVRNNILDQLFLIERYGKVLNGNRSFYLTRGQPPLLAWSVDNYLRVRSGDDELAELAYPLLERAYREYWNGPDHATPVGLSTCRDSGKGSDMDQELAAEDESGLDYTPIFAGDIRHCVPIHVNCALLHMTQVLATLADRFGWQEKAAFWKHETDARAERIQKYCWDETEGFYFEYDFVRGARLPFYSLNGYWPVWAGIATAAQARRAADHLQLFDQPYGLSFTDREYPNPHPQFAALEWAYPESWPPQQIIVAHGLERYGFMQEAEHINRRYLANVVKTWEETGETWERYNAVKGGHECPIERTAVAKLHGWSSASAVIIGRMLFGNVVTKTS